MTGVRQTEATMHRSLVDKPHHSLLLPPHTRTRTCCMPCIPCTSLRGTVPAPGASHCMSTVKTAWSGVGVSRTTNGVLALRTANVAATRVSEDKSACAGVVVQQWYQGPVCVHVDGLCPPLQTPPPFSLQSAFASFTTKHDHAITQSTTCMCMCTYRESSHAAARLWLQRVRVECKPNVLCKLQRQRKVPTRHRVVQLQHVLLHGDEDLKRALAHIPGRVHCRRCDGVR